MVLVDHLIHFPTPTSHLLTDRTPKSLRQGQSLPRSERPKYIAKKEGKADTYKSGRPQSELSLQLVKEATYQVQDSVNQCVAGTFTANCRRTTSTAENGGKPFFAKKNTRNALKKKTSRVRITA
jgi:hypothetical protein